MRTGRTPAALASLAPIAALAVLPSLATAQGNTPDLRPALAPAPVEKVFVPLGFDDNDNVEIVLAGHFTNACSKVGPVEVAVDAARKTVTLSPKMFVYDRGGRCAAQEMYLPFSQTVNLGTLDVGDYKVRLASQPDLAAEDLRVERATKATPDDYLYAPVDDVLVRQQPSLGGKLRRITLRGTFPTLVDGCFALKEVRTNVTPGNVVVVLPIVETLGSGDCASRGVSREFSFRSTIAADIKGMALVHVRVMNGQSFNRVVRVDP